MDWAIKVMFLSLSCFYLLSNGVSSNNIRAVGFSMLTTDFSSDCFPVGILVDPEGIKFLASSLKASVFSEYAIN